MSKTIWNVLSKSFNIFFTIVLCSIIFLSFWLPYKVGIDFGALMLLLCISLIPIFVANIITRFPILLQVVYLVVYYKFAKILILKILMMITGTIDYNFAWTTPEWINNILGRFIDTNYATFIFLAGFIITILLMISVLSDKYLIHLAKKEVVWAKEILSKRMKNPSDQLDQLAMKKGGEVIPPTSYGNPEERIVYRPKFFKDKLWYQFFIFPVMLLPVLLLFFFTDFLQSGVGLFLGGILFATLFPFTLWELTTTIVLEKDKIIIRSWLSRRTILFDEISVIDSAENGAMRIVYAPPDKRDKAYQLLPWAYTTELVVQELKNRIKRLDIKEELIIKRVRMARSFWGVVMVCLIVVALMGGVGYWISTINKAEDYTKQGCSEQLEFWISDRDTVNILDTKDGVIPEISISNPLYFFVKSKVKAVECTEGVRYYIYDMVGYKVYESTDVIPGYLEDINNDVNISYFYTSDIFRNTGDYNMKIYYGDILTDEIYFRVR